MEEKYDIRQMQKEAHRIAKSKGWHDVWLAAGFGAQIANMHSELSEAWEYWRKDFKTPSDHIPEFTGVEEEFADVIIRVLDTAQHNGLRVIEAIFAKCEFNKTREYRHGGKKA